VHKKVYLVQTIIGVTLCHPNQAKTHLSPVGLFFARIPLAIQAHLANFLALAFFGRHCCRLLVGLESDQTFVTDYQE